MAKKPLPVTKIVPSVSDEVRDKLEDYWLLQQSLKDRYQELDEQLQFLLDRVPVGAQVRLASGELLELADAFKGGNTQWKSTAFRRFEFKLVKEPAS